MYGSVVGPYGSGALYGPHLHPPLPPAVAPAAGPYDVLLRLHASAEQLSANVDAILRGSGGMGAGVGVPAVSPAAAASSPALGAATVSARMARARAAADAAERARDVASQERDAAEEARDAAEAQAAALRCQLACCGEAVQRADAAALQEALQELQARTGELQEARARLAAVLAAPPLCATAHRAAQTHRAAQAQAQAQAHTQTEEAAAAGRTTVSCAAAECLYATVALALKDATTLSPSAMLAALADALRRAAGEELQLPVPEEEGMEEEEPRTSPQAAPPAPDHAPDGVDAAVEPPAVVAAAEASLTEQPVPAQLLAVRARGAAGRRPPSSIRAPAEESALPPPAPPAQRVRVPSIFDESDEEDRTPVQRVALPPPPPKPMPPADDEEDDGW